MARINQTPQDPEVLEATAVLTQLASVFLPEFPGPLHKSHINPDEPSAEAKYQALIEQIPAVVFMARLDRGLGEAYVSPQIETMLGFTQQEWLGDPVLWYRQIHPDDKARWSVDGSRLLLTGDPLNAVYRVLSRDGRVVWFQCEVRMVRMPDGLPWFIHGVGFDVTELKRAEQVVREAHDQLEIRVAERTAELKQSNAELQRFAYVASHDLQEPLRTVTSFTELLANRYKGALDARADGYIDFILDGAKHMQMLISDLLTYSRLGTKPKPFETVYMDTVMSRAMSNLKVAIAESGAAVTQDPLPTIIGDPVQMVELFQNLIANAIKFRGSNPAQVHVSARPDGANWHFAVRDNGIGIDAKHMERIFFLFQRLHTRDEYPGTGIGLAICKKIVEHHGGRIWAESTRGRGTTFQFTLPRRP